MWYAGMSAFIPRKDRTKTVQFGAVWSVKREKGSATKESCAVSDVEVAGNQCAMFQEDRSPGIAQIAIATILWQNYFKC